MTNDFTMRVLTFFSRHDVHDALWWKVVNGKVQWFVNCNDVFAWGCSDCEELTTENFPILEQAMTDAIAAEKDVGELYADELFVSRVRGMRPQTASYPHYPKEMWPLFDACGPEREAGFGNPYTRERAEAEWEKNYKAAATGD